MAKEIERKFIFKGGVQAAKDFLDKQEAISPNGVKEVEINQYYFLSQLVVVSFDFLSYEWKIFFNEQNKKLSIPALEEEKEQIVDLLSGNLLANLVDIKRSSFRLRKSDEQWIFTAKFNEDDEFEYEINLDSDIAEYSFKNLPPVFKQRFKMKFSELKTDLDFFKSNASKIDHLLEFEFPSYKDAKSFNPAHYGLEVIEVSGDSRYKNLFIALANYNEASAGVV
ncbi:MAG TPA: hypothetical protein DCL21_07000 [Alphaproteobacteria bacterium]|nr:hypothetical protein [Alphaproteobacteria bacterium]